MLVPSPKPSERARSQRSNTISSSGRSRSNRSRVSRCSSPCSARSALPNASPSTGTSAPLAGPHAQEVLRRPADALLEIHQGFEAEDVARLVELRDAQLDVGRCSAHEPDLRL